LNILPRTELSQRILWLARAIGLLAANLEDRLKETYGSGIEGAQKIFSDLEASEKACGESRIIYRMSGQVRRDTLEPRARYEASGETVSHDEVDAWLGTDREGKCPAR